MVHKTLHLSSEFLLIHPRVSNIPKCILNISWKPPVDPFITLNIDDSALGNKKNSHGKWISGFYSHIGLTTNNIAELWAVRQRLSLAWDAGINFLNIEVDSTLVIKYLTFLDHMALAFAYLICDCWILLARDWMVRLHHTYHEARGVTDRLAKRGREQSNQPETYAQCSS